MNKYLKYFSGTLVGLMLSTSAFAAAEYAVVLKTLSNPFWVDMKKGIEDEAKTLGVSVDIFASPSEGDFQSQLQLFEDLSNKNYKGIAFAPLSSVNLVMPVARAWKKGIYLVNLDEKIDMDNLKKAGGNVEAFVTTDNVAVGAKGASFIIDKLGAEGGEVAIIEGKAGNASGEARRNGATEAFKKASRSSLSPASLPTGTALKHWMSPLTCCNVIRILKRSIARMTRWQWVLLRQSQTPEKREKCWSSVQMAFRKPAKWWKPDK
ncbi:D-allose transporter subunit [Escherichia coli]|nr:D-allose transporter subunit [Escherichia coli]